MLYFKYKHLHVHLYLLRFYKNVFVKTKKPMAI